MPKIIAEKRLAHVLSDRRAGIEQCVHERDLYLDITAALRFYCEHKSRLAVLLVRRSVEI
jgi:hypothetical protein